MELGIDILAMLFAAAFIAAFIDAIAGGGGLITIPALLMTGMPPAMALGTNKLQAFGGALSASIYFLRKRAVNLSEFSFILLVIFIGSVIGTLLIQSLDALLIKKGLPFLILAIGLYFLFTPKLGESDEFNLKFSLINFFPNWWSCDLDCWVSHDGRKPDRCQFRG